MDPSQRSSVGFSCLGRARHRFQEVRSAEGELLLLACRQCGFRSGQASRELVARAYQAVLDEDAAAKALADLWNEVRRILSEPAVG